MADHFTYQASDNIWTVEIQDNHPEAALEYLNNPANFRSFSDGLTELILKYGYQGNAKNADEKTDFLIKKLASIYISITKSTVRDWFLTKRRPALVPNGRLRMFQVCFALSATLEDVVWFFHHVYFDRCFNCHTIEEAVYYYCFSNRLTYPHAAKLLQTIQDYPAPNHSCVSHVFTQDIRSRLERCASDTELLDFFKEHKSIFAQWNKSARKYISCYVSLIRGKPEDKTVVKAFRAGTAIPESERKRCGLVIQEYLSAPRQSLHRSISGRNITSIDFMLEQMIGINSGISKEAMIPDIVKTNFPSKKTFSDILNKSETSTSYDSIRKCLILLKFYHFWTSFLLNPSLFAASDGFDIFVEETDALLISCGHEALYAGNPYDWLFLWAAATDRPLDALRNTVHALTCI